MRQLTLVLIGVGVAFSLVGPAVADMFVFAPEPPDLGDLDHEKCFKWGINWALPEGQEITSAVLTYKNIYNWEASANVLYTHLLDTVTDTNGWFPPNWVQKPGYQTITITKTDYQSKGDAFTGQGVKLGEWSDPDGPRTKIDLAYAISADQFSWLSDGNFGFGIDPDCHYYNDGVSFVITTSSQPGPPVPAPAAALLGVFGLGIIGVIRRYFA